MLVTLDRVEIADRDEQAILRRDSQFLAKRGAFSRRERHAIGNGDDASGRHEEVSTEVTGKPLRDRDCACAEGNRRAEREPPAEMTGIITPAVHRDHVGDADKLRRPRAVHRHRELVAVSDRHAVPDKRGGQRSRSGRRERPRQTKMLDVHARSPQFAGEPSFAVFRKKDNARTAAGLKPTGQLREDAFSAPGAVGRDQLCDAQTARCAALGLHYRYSDTFLRSGWFAEKHDDDISQEAERFKLTDEPGVGNFDLR